MPKHNPDLIRTILTQLNRRASSLFGQETLWRYDEATDSFNLDASQMPPERLEDLKADLTEGPDMISVQDIIARRISPQKDAMGGLEAIRIDMPNIETYGGEPIKIIPAEIKEPSVSKRRAVTGADLPLLESLEVAKCFPPQITTGKWHFHEGPPTYAYVRLTLPSASKKSDLRMAIDEFPVALNIAAGSAKVNEAEGIINVKAGAARFIVEIEEKVGIKLRAETIDPETFPERLEEMRRTIVQQAKYLEQAINERAQEITAVEKILDNPAAAREKMTPEGWRVALREKRIASWEEKLDIKSRPNNLERPR